MKILLLDNYDSFTYNLLHAVKELGATDVEVVRNDQINLDEVERFNKIILSPGPGIPEEAGLLLPIIKRYAPTKSILGVCLGHQAIGEAFGARLENLKEVIRYVSDYEDEFVQMVMDTDMRQRNKELSQKKKRLTEIHSRIQELDKIFQRIYEDNISGKLSDERFMKLSKGYEEEQHTLQEEQTSLEKELQKEEKQSVDVKQFLSVVRKYTNLTELTPEIVHEFIDKIIVHAPDKSSGKRLQEIEIIYNHIGVFDHSKVTLWKGKAV